MTEVRFHLPAAIQHQLSFLRRVRLLVRPLVQLSLFLLLVLHFVPLDFRLLLLLLFLLLLLLLLFFILPLLLINLYF